MRGIHLAFLPVFCLVATLFSLNIVFKEKPVDFQFYPRNASNMGMVRISGVLLDKSIDTLRAIILRNDKPYSRAALPVVFTNDSALFDFSLPIDAELAEYSLRLHADTGLVATADSLVAGDAILVNGQSNAWAGAGDTNARNSEDFHEYVRTRSPLLSGYGYRITMGMWATRIGCLINRKQGVPVFIVNGGQSAMPLGVFMPTSGNYRNVRNLFDSTGLRNQVRAIFWFQGEANSADTAMGNPVTGYAAQFKILYDAWKRDYVSVRGVYVCQIAAEGSVLGMARNLREILRRLPETCPEVRVMGTAGVVAHHSWADSYILGERLHRLMARDVYGSPDTAGAGAPDIRRAWFSSPARDRVTLEFDQPVFFRDSLGHRLARYFALDSAYDVADSGWDEPDFQRIVLRLKAPSSATKISYWTNGNYLPGDTANTRAGSDMRYRGPFLYNARRVPALAFHEVPVGAPRSSDTASVVSLALSAAKASLLRFEGVQLSAVATYSGGGRDTNTGVAFQSLNPFVAGMEGNGLVRGHNPGIARVVARKGGRSDTLDVTVGGGFVPFAGIEFTGKVRTLRTLLAGDSMRIGLAAKILEGPDTLRFSLDTVAVFGLPGPQLSVRAGYLHADQAGGDLLLTGEASGMRCSTRVTVSALPLVIRRINFQKTTAAFSVIPGWEIETGTAYSAGRGFGWLPTSAPGVTLAGWSMDTTEEPNYFKNTGVVSKTGYTNTEREFRLDVPSGVYRLRVANYNNSNCNGYAWVACGSDTLVRNAACSYANHRWGMTVTRRITVAGDSGLILKVGGAVCYLVLMSDDGSDFDLAAGDGALAPGVPGTTDGELAGLNVSAGLRETPLAVPNPFNRTAQVRFGLPSGVSAVYGVYNIRGQCLRTVLLNRTVGVRERVVLIGAGDGRSWAAGVYYGRLVRSDGKRFSHRLIVVR